MDPREQVLKQIEKAITSIRLITKFKPKVGLVLGSGFAKVAEAVNEEAKIPYAEIGHFPISTIKGHPGNLILGSFAGQNLAVLQGRFHFYPPSQKTMDVSPWMNACG